MIPQDAGHPQSQVYGQTTVCGPPPSALQSGNNGITADYLVNRCFGLIKIALQLDIWPNTEIRYMLIERALAMCKENHGLNSVNAYHCVCMAIELLIIFLQTMKKEKVLNIFVNIQKAISITCTCTHSKVVRTMHQLLSKLMAIFPPSCAGSTISPKSGAPVKVSDLF